MTYLRSCSTSVLLAEVPPLFLTTETHGLPRGIVVYTFYRVLHGNIGLLTQKEARLLIKTFGVLIFSLNAYASSLPSVLLISS